MKCKQFVYVNKIIYIFAEALFNLNLDRQAKINKHKEKKKN